MKATNKENQELESFLKGKSALILTDSPTDKVAWKSLLNQIGVNLKEIHHVKAIDEATKFIETKKVDIFFSSYRIKNEETFCVLKTYLDKYPDRSEHFCYYVSEKNSLTLSALVAEMELDALIIRPYNQNDLIKTLKESMLDAATMGKGLKNFYRILGDIRSNNLDKALKEAQDYIKNKESSANGYYLLGLVYKEKGDTKDAIEIWEQGLSKKNDHYQILCALFDLLVENEKYIKAYRLSEKISAIYPVNPERIPNIIRTCLATGNHETLITFCETILELDEDLGKMTKPIAAALALCAKSMIQQEVNKELAFKVSIRAMNLAELQSKIHLACLENLFDLEKYDELKANLDKIPIDNMKIDFEVLNLLVIERTQPAEDAYTVAHKMYKSERLAPNLFRVLIRCAKKIGKPKVQLEDFAFEGGKSFSELKVELNSLID